MMYRLERTQQLNCTIDVAWNFFSSPHNLEKITPAKMKFLILSDLKEEIFEGMIIDYKIRPLFNFPVRWTTRITQVDFQKSFTDFQQKGPYKTWNHNHQFEVNENGVLMKDIVDYQLPYGWLGDLVHSMLVKRKLERIFNFRYQVLEELFNKQSVL